MPLERTLAKLPLGCCGDFDDANLIKLVLNVCKVLFSVKYLSINFVFGFGPHHHRQPGTTTRSVLWHHQPKTLIDESYFKHHLEVSYGYPTFRTRNRRRRRRREDHSKFKPASDLSTSVRLTTTATVTVNLVFVGPLLEMSFPSHTKSGVVVATRVMEIMSINIV